MKWDWKVQFEKEENVMSSLHSAKKKAKSNYFKSYGQKVSPHEYQVHFRSQDALNQSKIG